MICPICGSKMDACEFIGKSFWNCPECDHLAQEEGGEG